MAMFVYLDESGDTGFKFNQGSTRFFVITLLLVDDPIPIQVAIDELRASLGFSPRDEFKFSHSAKDVRERFLRELRRHPIAVRALVVDKTLLTRPHMRKRETFYNYLIKLILQHDGGAIANATLVLDESVKSKQAQRHLGSSLRHALNNDPAAPKVRAIVHHASHTDNLIQATDMVSGAIYSAHAKGDDSYLRLVRMKVQDLWPLRPYTQ